MAGEWQEIVFSQAVEINPRVQLKRGENYPFVDMAAITAKMRRVISTETRTFNGGGSRFAGGDTLMARITPCLENGKIARYFGAPGQLAHGSTEFIVIRGRKDISETAYAYYLTKWAGVREYAISQMTGTSGRQRVPTSAFDHLTVPIPPPPEQHAIAQILGALDEKIELNQRMTLALEEMLRALFKSWFIDFDPVRAKAEGRDYCIPKPISDLFPDKLIDSELGEIPEGWEVRPVGELANVLGGSTPSTKERSYWEGGTHAWATPKDLSGLSVPVLLDTERKITDAGLSQIGSGLLPVGTVLLSSRAPIGYLAISEIPVAINQGFIAMTAKPGTSNLFLLFWASLANDKIVSRANGSTFLEISKSNFRPILIATPSARVMQEYEKQARPLYRRIVECAQESCTLADLRDALLPMLISGELRVKDIKKFIRSAV